MTKDLCKNCSVEAVLRGEESIKVSYKSPYRNVHAITLNFCILLYTQYWLAEVIT